MKVARHEKIIELIHQYEIDTQEELASRLNEAGFKVCVMDSFQRIAGDNLLLANELIKVGISERSIPIVKMTKI